MVKKHTRQPLVDPGGALGAYGPPSKIQKKNDFLASFEGFWTIKQFLDALHHLVWPSN